MAKIYELEQLEYVLYQARGYPIKLEPFLLTLFHSQVKDGPCVFGMLLAKWYSRLHFAELGPNPDVPTYGQKTAFNLSNDLFQNSVQERAFEYLYVHFLTETKRIPGLIFDKRMHIGSKKATPSLTGED